MSCHFSRPVSYHVRERTPCIQWKGGRLWPAEYLYAVQEKGLFTLAGVEARACSRAFRSVVTMLTELSWFNIKFTKINNLMCPII